MKVSDLFFVDGAYPNQSRSVATVTFTRHAAVFHFTQQEGDSMATQSEHELAELKRELAELAKQAERLAGRAREISDHRSKKAHHGYQVLCDPFVTFLSVGLPSISIS